MMSQKNQSEVTSGDAQQHQALGAEDIVQQTTPSDAAGPYTLLRSQASLTNMCLSQGSAGDDVSGRQYWPQPLIPNKNRAGHCTKGCSTSGVGQVHGGQRLDAKGSSSFAEPNAMLGHSLHHPHATSGIPSPFTGQQQPPESLPFWHPTQMADFPERLSKTGLPHATESGYPTDQFGLPTPASTNAQNSPYDEGAERTNSDFESQGQQLWDHNFDATPFAHNVSDASTADMLFSDFVAPQERQLWGAFDFDSLDGPFGMNEMTMLNGSAGNSDAAAQVQDAELKSHQGGYVPDPSIPDSFDPFLTGMNYPDPDFDGISSESRTARKSLHPAFVIQTAGCYSVPALLGPADVLDPPSPDGKLVGTPAKPSQEQNAKNALLIHYKEQGMSYKDIKALGGFEEAESTLRGRYRTLTKPKEERVRRPEWKDRDVSALHRLWKKSRNSR